MSLIALMMMVVMMMVMMMVVMVMLMLLLMMMMMMPFAFCQMVSRFPQLRAAPRHAESSQ